MGGGKGISPRVQRQNVPLPPTLTRGENKPSLLLIHLFKWVSFSELRIWIASSHRNPPSVRSIFTLVFPLVSQLIQLSAVKNSHVFLLCPPPRCFNVYIICTYTHCVRERDILFTEGCAGEFSMNAENWRLYAGCAARGGLFTRNAVHLSKAPRARRSRTR